MKGVELSDPGRTWVYDSDIGPKSQLRPHIVHQVMSLWSFNRGESFEEVGPIGWSRVRRYELGLLEQEIDLTLMQEAKYVGNGVSKWAIN